MKSMKKLVLGGLVLLASVVVLVGCDTNAGDNSTPTVKPEVLEYTVTFNSNGGSEVATQTVKNGKTVSNPENPTKIGFLFDGWYSDSELKNLFDFATPITGNIALYAKWQEKVTEVLEYTVTFNSNGGSEVATQTVKNGKTVSKPENPTKTDFLFDGWFSDSELKNLFDFATPITGNIALYAKWQKTFVGEKIEAKNETFATVLAEVMQKPKITLSLTEDISVSETIEITDGDFILDLNGHKLEGSKYPILKIAEGSALVIQDSGENGCITGSAFGASGVSNNGSLIMNSGSILITRNGGYAYGVDNTGNFTMTGGSITVTGSTNNVVIDLVGVNNGGTLWISGGTIDATGTGDDATLESYCYGISHWGTLYLSGNPSITGFSNKSSSKISFRLLTPITLVGKLSNKYGMESYLNGGETAVVGGEEYILTEDDKAKFELSNKNMELVLDKEQNTLVLKETSTN